MLCVSIDLHASDEPPKSSTFYRAALPFDLLTKNLLHKKNLTLLQSWAVFLLFFFGARQQQETHSSILSLLWFLYWVAGQTDWKAAAACSAFNSPADNMEFVSLWDLNASFTSRQQTPRPPCRPAAKLEPNTFTLWLCFFVTNILQRNTCLPEAIMHLINVKEPR